MARGQRRPKWELNREKGVPLEGDIAFSSGWNVDYHNPHEPDDPAHRYWIADWWRANAEAYDSHVNGLIEYLEDTGQLPVDGSTAARWPRR